MALVAISLIHGGFAAGVANADDFAGFFYQQGKTHDTGFSKTTIGAVFHLFKGIRRETFRIFSESISRFFNDVNNLFSVCKRIFYNKIKNSQELLDDVTINRTSAYQSTKRPRFLEAVED